MTFEEFILAADTLAPTGMHKVVADSYQAYYSYEDSTNDRIEIEFYPTYKSGERMVLRQISGASWYLSPQFCHWLGAVATLIEEVEA